MLCRGQNHLAAPAINQHSINVGQRRVTKLHQQAILLFMFHLHFKPIANRSKEQYYAVHSRNIGKVHA
jgi:hypothetical protein